MKYEICKECAGQGVDIWGPPHETSDPCSICGGDCYVEIEEKMK